MLKSWSIKNFKSFGAEQTLDLTGINVFAGANSTGKSTIIQSLLLLKQTIQYGHNNRTLVLNGPLLKLGTFEDIKNDASDEADGIEISWVFSPKLDEWETVPAALRPTWLRQSTFFWGGKRGHVESISTRLEWNLATPSSELLEDQGNAAFDGLYPSLETGLLSCKLQDDTAQYSWRYELKTDPIKEITGLLSGLPFEEQSYNTTLDLISQNEILEDKPDGEIAETILKHFLPIFAVVDYDVAAQRASFATRSIASARRSTLLDRRIDEGMILPADTINAINEWGEKNFSSPLFPPGTATFAQVRDAVGRVLRPSNALLMGDEKSTTLGSARAELLELVEQKLYSSMPAERDTTYERPHALSSAEGVLSSFFTSAVRYLGPLRDEPRPVYPVEALEEPTVVGYRGEHTAAVLDLNRRRLIQFISPQAVLDGSFATDTQPLDVAVNAWANYMGVASRIVTREHGVFGHRMQVAADNVESPKQLRDLTNVGVGVSQLLPILVMALLAPQGSLLIFEQPELHLHPKVQARLADFFIATALTNKQCILETHSEYLIDRFRRRIAESDGSTIEDLVGIFFVERTGSESICRRVEVTEYGAVRDWPKDFFDQSQEEAEAILQAAYNKSKSQKK